MQLNIVIGQAQPESGCAYIERSACLLGTLGRVWNKSGEEGE